MGLFNLNEEGEFAPNSYQTRNVDNGTPDVKISVPGGLNETPSSKPYDLKSISIPGGDGERPSAKLPDDHGIITSNGTEITDGSQKEAIAALQKSFKEGYEATCILARQIEGKEGNNNMYSENMFGFFSDDESFTESVYSEVKKAFNDKLPKELKGSVADDGNDGFMNKKAFDALKAKIQEDLDKGYKDYVANCGNYKAKKQAEWEAANIIQRIKNGTFGSKSDGMNAVAANKQAKQDERNQKREDRSNAREAKRVSREEKKNVAKDAKSKCEQAALAEYKKKGLDGLVSEKQFVRNYMKKHMGDCIKESSKSFAESAGLSIDEYCEIYDDVYGAFVFESSIDENVNGENYNE